MTTQQNGPEHPLLEKIVDGILDHNGRSPLQLLQILNDIEAQYHHVPEKAIALIAHALSIPRTGIVALIEFYSFLNLTPRGNYVILVSDSITDRMLGNQAIIDLFCEELGIISGEVRSDGRVSIDTTSCTGLCEQGPAALINGYAVPNLSVERVMEIVALIDSSIPLEQWPSQLFQVNQNIRQRDIVLSYTQENGEYSAGKALRETFHRGLQTSLDELTTSELRGRGGAGFKTSMKWHFCHESYTTGDERNHRRDDHDDRGLVCDVKSTDITRDCDRIVVCNADEGEPGTFKDRVILTEMPEMVFEGMAVAA